MLYSTCSAPVENGIGGENNLSSMLDAQEFDVQEFDARCSHSSCRPCDCRAQELCHDEELSSWLLVVDSVTVLLVQELGCFVRGRDEKVAYPTTILFRPFLFHS